MAKTKSRPASAAQRREQERQQRINTNQTTRPAQSRGRRSRAKKSNSWLLIGGIVLGVALIVGFFVFQANQQKPATTTATPQVFTAITHIDPNLLATVNTGGLDSSMKSSLVPVKNTPVLKGPTGKPELFYMGAEYCPYCAAQRWPMIIALSRFGQFGTPPTPIISSESSVPSYSFYKSTYTSQYVDFVPVEVQDNQTSPQQLEPLSPDQQLLVNKYDAPPYTQSSGSFPFMDIGNQLVSSGSFYLPDVLIGNSYQQIADQIKDPTSKTSQNILGSANYITASICSITQNQPASVCTANPVPQIEQSLPKTTAFSSGNTLLGSIDMPPAIAVRKPD
ncbi:MAG: hypothetical protein NVSMB44_17570 [Ktedonobacteraceae bacterium]